MPELESIPQNVVAELDQLAAAKVVIGVPTYNNAATVSRVIQTIEEGLAKYFSESRAALVNADGGSKDGTTDLVASAKSGGNTLLQITYPIYPVDKLSTPYHGIPGRGRAFQSIFQIAQKLQAEVCVVLDADHPDITPEWVDRLIRPVLERGFDVVVPCWRRHKYDGILNSGIVYPMVRALYGKRIRQPLGGDFAFSAQVVEGYLRQDVWDSEVARFGLGIWLMTQAITGGFKICQTLLGPDRHSPRDTVPDLSVVLAQVVGSLYWQLDHTAGDWQKVRESEALPTFGTRGDAESEPVPVNVKRLLESFRLGYKELSEVWGLVLPPATLVELKRLSRMPEESFRFQDELWVRTVYDFSLGYRTRTIGRDHLLRALTPLYLGWVASFILETENFSGDEVERRIEKLCLTYESQKPYLISRWRWPDRFNP